MLNPDDIYLIDIDGTLTVGDIFIQAPESLIWSNGVLHVIADHYARHHALDPVESQRQIRACADDLVWWDYPDFIAEFGLDPVLIQAEISAFHASCLQPQPDAVRVVQALASAGKTLCIMSNNPVTGSLHKLRAIGLADTHGAPLFRHIFGSNNLRGQKSSPPMWGRLIAHLGVSPERLVTIGDNPKDDGQAPCISGIGRGYLLGASTPVGDEAGRIAVSSWSELADHLWDRQQISPVQVN